LVPSKPTLPESTVASIAIDHQMAIIQVQIRKNFIEDVFLDGGFGVNIITKKLRVQLILSKPKLAPYNLRMANQTITNHVNVMKST
jgi:hypothetical protein